MLSEHREQTMRRMELNLTHSKHIHPRSGRPTRRALHLGAGALTALTIGFSPFLLHSPPGAYASEFEAKPDAKLEFECNNDSPAVSINLYNTGNVTADFTIDAVINGNPSQQQEQVVSYTNVGFALTDHTGNSFDIVSNSGKGFSQHWDVPVDCDDDMDGSIKLYCPDQYHAKARAYYSTFNNNFAKKVHFDELMPDGSTKSFDTGAKSGASIEWPLDEGDHVVGNIYGNGKLLASIDSYVDCEQEPPPSDPPPTTEPPPSDPPPTTGPPHEDPPPTDPPSGGDLPETGSSSTFPMAVIGAGLAAAGMALVTTTRRRQRNAR